MDFVGRADSVFSDDDKGDIVFSDDVREPAVIKAFVEAAGDVNYEPIPEEGPCAPCFQIDSNEQVNRRGTVSERTSTSPQLGYFANTDTRDKRKP